MGHLFRGCGRTLGPGLRQTKASARSAFQSDGNHVQLHSPPLHPRLAFLLLSSLALRAASIFILGYSPSYLRIEAPLIHLDSCLLSASVARSHSSLPLRGGYRSAFTGQYASNCIPSWSAGPTETYIPGAKTILAVYSRESVRHRGKPSRSSLD